MKYLAIGFAVTWVACLVIAPFAIIGMVIFGIWGDTRWIFTACVLIPTWILAVAFTTAIGDRGSKKGKSLDVPSWVNHN